jgi:hypothetical protein
MKNPLYPSKLIDSTNIREYNRCYIITLEEQPVVEVFDEHVDQPYFNKVKENYKISLVPMWMVKSIQDYQNKFIMFELSEDDLLKFNFINYDFDNNLITYDLMNACIFIPNHNWYWFHQYIEIYLVDGFKSLYHCVKDIIYSNIKLHEITKEIMRSTDVTYWKNINKCMINITSPWLQRDINFSDAKEINIVNQKQMTDKCNNYLENIYKKNNYVDASTGIKTRKYNLYYINEYSSTPIDEVIVMLINDPMIEVQQKYDIINYGLVSKKYCHHFIKNNDILQFINSNFNSFVKSYGYAWLMMYIEEGILKSRINSEDRCIFTLNQARKLPFSNKHNNIYIPLMVEKTYINFFGGYQSNNIDQTIELSDIDTFKNRLLLFSNSNNIDIFKNLDWTNIAISGSVIPATCRKIDPLEKDGGYTTKQFFDTYYKDSDIDVMCDLPTYVLFIDKVNYMIDVFRKNILEKFPESINPINVVCAKNAALQITKKYIDEHYNGKITDVEAYKIYCKIKVEEDWYTDDKYSKINEIVTMENFKYYIHDNNESKKPEIGENIKFHISSPYLSRNFEIFRIKYNFFATVSRFHLPCVRGYYDGNELYLLPSAISALLTNKCIDYKYFAGVRSPFEILLKYIFRGYTIFLNKKEMVKMVEYIKNSEKWKNIFNYDESFRLNTFQSYYTNPFVLLNSTTKYYDYRKYVESNMISPIISSLGYVIPL